MLVWIAVLSPVIAFVVWMTINLIELFTTPKGDGHFIMWSEPGDIRKPEDMSPAERDYWLANYKRWSNS